MEETVSIIIPVYCAESTLVRCVESIIQGTYTDIEIILVEDCSPDQSWAICLQLQEKYTCVKAYQNIQNCGVSAARNRGLREMTGKYLMFVDSDDWVEPDFVAFFVEAYRKHHPDLIISGYMNHDEVQNAALEYFGWGNNKEITVKNLREELLSLYNGRLLQQIWNKLFLVSIILDNHITFDTSIHMGEDFRFLLSYMESISGNKLVEINIPLYHYIRCSSNSLMSQFGKEKIDEPLKDLARLYVLIGMSAEEIEKQLTQDRSTQINLWAYLIMHNIGMRSEEKRQRILALDAQEGKALYRKNILLYCKERVLVFLKRLGIRK